MARFQSSFPLLKTNFNRRRSRTWQILGLIVILFLILTLMAMRYLPTVVIDPVSVLKSQDFQNIFVPPIPRPPMNWPHQDHNHSLHIEQDQARFEKQIKNNKQDFINRFDSKNINENIQANLPNLDSKTKFNELFSTSKILSLNNLTELFGQMKIEDLQQIKSNEIRREKVREVS